MRIVPKATRSPIGVSRSADMVSRYRDIEELGHPQGENCDSGATPSRMGGPVVPSPGCTIKSNRRHGRVPSGTCAPSLPRLSSLGKKGIATCPPCGVPRNTS